MQDITASLTRENYNKVNGTQFLSWDRKESIKTKAEQATVVLLTKIFQKFGVNNACERLLAWADIHRKAMFGITISFLYFVTILSLVMRPERKPMQVFNEEKSKVQINIDSNLQKKQVGQMYDLKDQLPLFLCEGKNYNKKIG